MARHKARNKKNQRSNGNVVDINDYKTPIKHRKKKVDIIPRNEAQEDYIFAMEDCRVVFGVGPAGTGKAQPLYSNIKTPTGWTSMGDIKIGDNISTPDGKTSMVSNIYPQGIKKIYRVSFEDGSFADCCDDHLWKIYNVDFEPEKERIIPLSEIRKLFKLKSKKNRLYIPLTNAVYGDYKPVDIDPYVLGVLIGDGCIVKGVTNFSSMDEQIIENVTRLLLEGYKIKKLNKCDYSILMTDSEIDNTKIQGKKEVYRHKYRKILNHLGLYGKRSHEKFIPKPYFDLSIEQRYKLIQGLMDTDGTVGKKGDVQYTTTSEQLANDVQYLIRSVGGRAIIKKRITEYTYKGVKKKGKISYTLHVTIQDPSTLFLLERKKERTRIIRKDGRVTLRHKITNIEYIGDHEAQCISISSDDHLYITDNFIVTHNTLLATLTAIKALKSSEIEKIIITRPMVSVDEDIGFLPGDLLAKTAPWTRPIIDILEEYYHPKQISGMLEEGIIEISPLAFMRGRTHKNSFIILDESQNCTVSQVKMCLTRIGEGSRMVITGDLNQHDRGYESNGLKDFLDRIGNGTDNIAVVEFTRDDIERDPIVAEVLGIYGED